MQYLIDEKKGNKHIFDIFAVIFWRSQRNELCRDPIFWS